jgi:hypothetical protein
MEIIRINIVKDFSEYPGPRYIEQGSDSGEKFFKEILDIKMSEAIENGLMFEVDLDGTAGYASSFLDEAFGRLTLKYSKEMLIKHLKIISNDEPDWIEMIFNETIEEWENRRLEQIR